MNNWKLEVIAIAISIGAAGFSGWQAYEGHQARLDARRSQTEAREDADKAQKLQRELAENAAKEAKRSALLATTRTFDATSQLNLDPNIEVETAFQPFGNPPTAPRILLWNTGRADAVALSVALKLWVAGPTSSGSALAMSSEGGMVPDWRIPRLPAGDIATLDVQRQAVEPNPAVLAGGKGRQPFVELIIRYLRPADRKNYEKRAYYFLSQDRRWVGESDPRSKTEMNERIKSFLRNHPMWRSDFRPGLDFTHDVKIPPPRKR